MPVDWTTDSSSLTRDRHLAAALAGDSDSIPLPPTPGGRGVGGTVTEPRACSVISEPGTKHVSFSRFQIHRNIGKRFPRRVAELPSMAARWQRDLRYRLSGMMSAVAVVTEGAFKVEKSTELFAAPIAVTDAMENGSPFDVTANGQRFLFSVPAGTDATAPITVVTNWTTALAK